MAEYDEKTNEGRPARRRPDLLAMIAGLGTLMVAGYVLSDGAMWLPSVSPTWLLAGGAVLVGLLMLGTSLRGSRRGGPPPRD